MSIEEERAVKDELLGEKAEVSADRYWGQHPFHQNKGGWVVGILTAEERCDCTRVGIRSHEVSCTRSDSPSNHGSSQSSLVSARKHTLNK